MVKGEINKENIEKTNATKEEDVSKKQNKQLIWIVAIMVVSFGILIGGPLLYNKMFNNFNYLGLDFKKTNMGSITMYSVNIPVTDTERNPIGAYNLILREDPRELEKISVDVPDNEVVFVRPGPVYISMDSNIPVCPNNIVSVVGLTEFLMEFGKLNVKGAISDKKLANESKLTFANCDVNKNNTVIWVKNGNETSIKRTGRNCYEIEFKDCDINKAVEKFELIILKRYMNEF